jgi:hypothetical protein
MTPDDAVLADAAAVVNDAGAEVINRFQRATAVACAVAGDDVRRLIRFTVGMPVEALDEATAASLSVTADALTCAGALIRELITIPEDQP